MRNLCNFKKVYRIYEHRIKIFNASTCTGTLNVALLILLVMILKCNPIVFMKLVLNCLFFTLGKSIICQKLPTGFIAKFVGVHIELKMKGINMWSDITEIIV